MAGLAGFILLSSFSVIQTLEVPEQIHLTEVELGGMVTLTCEAHGHERALFYWFKLNYGYMVQTVAKGSFDNVNLDGQFINSRFTVLKKSGVYSLTIRNASKEDEATYLCQAGAAYTMTFVNSTYLAVRASQNELVYVNQSSDVSSVPPGSTAALQCSLYSEKEGNSHQCERNAFWFRAGSQSDPGLIYTDKTNCDQRANRSCVYKLSKTIQMPSDTGTYYCAVVTCGQILFGEGTKVETRQEVYPVIIVLGGLLGCSVLLNFTLIFTKKKQKQVSVYSKGNITASTRTKLDDSVEDEPCKMGGEKEGMNYVALNFSQRPTRWKNKREASGESTYSSIKLSVKDIHI